MISNSERKYLAVIGTLIIGLFVMEYLRPRPIDWNQTFSKSDRIPFGSKAIFDLLPSIFDGQEVATNQRTFYELSQESSMEDFNNIILINKNVSFDKSDWDALKSWLNDGGQLFLAAAELKTPDALDIEVNDKGFFNWQITQEGELDSTDYHRLANPALREEGYLFKKQTAYNIFDEINIEGVKLLAFNGDSLPTFIEIPWGEGRILWHCNPALFTNYNLLTRNNHSYLSKCLSYLPAKGTTLWDEYYKVGRIGAKTPLRVILSQPSLAWAWRLSLASIFLFIIFNMKRKQRAIPIVKPPRNTTLEFADTIGRLYLQHGDHQDLANKMVVFFKDYVRRKLYLPLQHFNTQEATLLSMKTGLDLDWIKSLLQRCQQVQQAEKLSEEQMKKLHEQLSQFYQSVTA